MSFNITSRIVIPLAGLFLLILVVTVTAATTTPLITVTSPNGGDTWQRGTTHTVSWSYSGSPGSMVKIVLVKAGTEIGTIIANTSIGSSGTGSYTWPISPSGSTGSDYKVSVQSVSQPTIKDVSNSYITLTSGTPGDWRLDLNGNGIWDSSTIDKAFQFGISGDIPVVGDWNGDGKDDIGIFRPGSGVWSLDSNGNNAWDVSDKSLSWGLSGDLPVVGDWNGDGKDDIGIFRPGSGVWSLDSNGNKVWDVSDRSLSWGVANDKPVTGDWNGDGKDEIGIFRPASATPSVSATPSITVTSPNGGEAWQRGTPRTVTWSYTGTTGSDVKIVLVKAGTEVGTIIASTPIGSGGTGSYTWPIGSSPSLATGSDFKVMVQSISQPTVKDTSNTIFTLTPVSSTTTTSPATPSTTPTPSIGVAVTPVPSPTTYGAEANPTGNPIGGGAGYTRIISPSDPRVKYVVSTKDQLLNALKNAKSGEVIFIPNTASIDLSGTYNTVIPAGVTLAGDRGFSGSSGGKILRHRVASETDYYKIPTLIVGGDNVRITGLQIQGFDVVQDQELENAGLEVQSAIKATGRNGLEVDNCELWGWSHAAIMLENCKSTYVHHNYIHHCQARGYGYGVALDGGQALIEANKFDYTRHAIEGEGKPGEGYEARYNLHLGHGEAIGGHHFDVHGYSYNGYTIAGNSYKIHHNTFLASKLPALGIRGKPITGVYVNNNIFTSSWMNEGVLRVGFQRSDGHGAYQNVFMTNNVVSGVTEATSRLAKEDI